MSIWRWARLPGSTAELCYTPFPDAKVWKAWVSCAILKRPATQWSWDELKKIVGHEEDYFCEIIHGRPVALTRQWWAERLPSIGRTTGVDGLCGHRAVASQRWLCPSPHRHPRSHPLISCPSYLVQHDASINILPSWQPKAPIFNLWEHWLSPFFQFIFCDINSIPCFFHDWPCWFPTNISFSWHHTILLTI